MTSLNLTALQNSEVSRHRHVARAVVRTVALILGPLIQAIARGATPSISWASMMTC